MPIYKFLFLS